MTVVLAMSGLCGMAQTQEVDATTGATRQATKTEKLTNALSRLSIGGYGEAVMTRNFYSQSFNRYKRPELYADDKSHGRFDLPHVCLNLGYDFGKGWTLGSEVEFEHGGSGSAVEIEAEEAGEYEAEVEKGGEVNIEQFWINKEFAGGKFNVKAGEIIVPVGYSNAYHEPDKFFTVYRPEGEATIMPNTWHQVGLSLWGRLKDWRYEAQLLSGLNSESFTAEDFVHYGATSPYEFKVANNYAGAAHFSDADEISAYNQANWTHHKYQDGNPHHYTNIGSHALAYALEAGYNVLALMHGATQKLYVFGHFEHYNTMASGTYASMYKYTKRYRCAFGLNYSPVRQVTIKGEYSYRFFEKPDNNGLDADSPLYKQPYNNEPSVSLGVTYCGWFF